MKKINKIQILLLLFLGLSFTSCETTDLDLINDPNEITIENGDLERFMVAIQIDYVNFIEAMGRNGAQLTRIEQMGSPSYINAYDPASTNYEWGLAYEGMFSDIKIAESLAIEGEANKHLGIMKILQASTLMTLVDYWGKVPFSEASNLEEYPNPSADEGDAIYASAIAMLDEAVAYLNQDGLGLDDDFFFDNDFAKWINLANTLKMKAYLNTRLVDGSALSNFNAIVNSGDYITSSDGDFQFTWDIVNNANIDARHPGYAADYASAGASRYRSDWLMDQMLDDNDPRSRYYFFRQNGCTPSGVGFAPLPDQSDSALCDADPERLFCSTDSSPSHYPGTMVFCWVDAGYWGRDHGFGGGIPPDTFSRTAVGVYPSAGLVDTDNFRNGNIELTHEGDPEDDEDNDIHEFIYDLTDNSVNLERGGQGAGITPIILASSVDFWKAEMALASGNAGSASQFASSGMAKSIAKVKSFQVLDLEYNGDLYLDHVEFDIETGLPTGPIDPDTGDISLDIKTGGLMPTSAEIASFIELQASNISDNSNSSWNTLAIQYFVSLYGNGNEAYNFYRRTGFPTTLQYNIEQNPGNFVRSFLYPADEANTNSNIQQKSNVDGQVFWDNNPPSPGFPSAN